MILIFVFLIISVLFESSLTSLPLTFLFLLFACVITQKKEVFALAFFAGLFLDILTFQPIGISSIYFLLFALAVFLYRSKFEIKTLGFFALFGFLGSLGYMFVKGSDYPVLGAFLAVLIGTISFKAFNLYAARTSAY